MLLRAAFGGLLGRTNPHFGVSLFGVQSQAALSATNARFEKGRVAIHGNSKDFVRTGDEGSRISYYFCPECGTTVYYQMIRSPT